MGKKSSSLAVSVFSVVLLLLVAATLSGCAGEKQVKKNFKQIAMPVKEVDSDKTTIEKLGRPNEVINLDQSGTKQVFEYRSDDELYLFAFMYDAEKKLMILKDSKVYQGELNIRVYDDIKKDKTELEKFLLWHFPFFQEPVKK